MIKKTNISLVVKGKITEDDFRDLNFLFKFGKISFRRKGERISRNTLIALGQMFSYLIEHGDVYRFYGG